MNFERDDERATRMWLRSSARLKTRYREMFGWLAVVSGLAWLQGAGVLATLGYAFKPYRVNDDALQQIFPFFEYFQSGAFSSDYIARYYLDCYPVGYLGLYAGAAKLGIDPTVLSRGLPFPLWMISVACLGLAADRLAGKLAAFGAMALALGNNAIMERIGGGLPRSFGFPIVSGTLLALAYGRVGWCAACVLLGALFYPVSGVIAGLCLASMVFASDIVGSEAARWGWVRRFGVVAATALLAGLLLLPSFISSSRYGGVVRPWETREYPEAGSGGRYDRKSRPPFPGFFASLPTPMDEALIAARPFSEVGQDWRAVQRRNRMAEGYRKLKKTLLILVLIGGAGLCLRYQAARRVLLLGVASGVGHAISKEIVPLAYLPERYVAYSAPLLAWMGISTALAGFFPRSFGDGPRRWLKVGSLGAGVAVLLFYLAGVTTPSVGLPVDLREGKRLYDAIGRLPANAVVAGWPVGPIENVPYAARRRVLLTVEVHQAFHKDYIVEMRHRMSAFIDAYFATSPEPIQNLRKRFGVTHLIVRHSDLEGKPPSYFKPFDRWIARSQRDARGKSFVLNEHLRQAKVVSDGGYVLLDLARIEPREDRK